MTAIIKNFYAGGNTARGFTSLFPSTLQGLEHLFILKGGPDTGKSALIQAIGDQMADNGHDIWFIHCASDNDSLDGLVIPALKIGIVGGVAPHAIEPQLDGVTTHIVEWAQICDTAHLRLQGTAIDTLNNEIKQAYERAYSGFAEALRIHDEWEALYISNMNFKAADELTREYIDILYGEHKQDKISRVDHRFLGAATPNGAVDFVPNLTEGLKRYLIKGRAGSGKSTMLKKLAAAASDRGFDVEIYHCGFDPNSLDMIIVRELGVAMFDSTAPHEYFPDRDTDEIVDTYLRCIKPGTDEEHAEALLAFKERYSVKMKQSTQYLTQAKALQDEREQLIAPFTDIQIIDQLRDDIQQQIYQIAAASVV